MADDDHALLDAESRQVIDKMPEIRGVANRKRRLLPHCAIRPELRTFTGCK
jgi:hypothetical protein